MPDFNIIDIYLFDTQGNISSYSITLIEYPAALFPQVEDLTSQIEDIVEAVEEADTEY